MVAWLKQLNSSEQVALLFVVLFGFLSLLTAGLFLNSLRERESEDERVASQLTWERVRRDLRAAWIGGCMFWVAWISGPLGATLLFALFSFLALREFITLVHTQRGDHREFQHHAFNGLHACPLGLARGRPAPSGGGTDRNGWMGAGASAARPSGAHFGAQG